MRTKIAGLLSVALMCVCSVATASIIYNVDITDGTETVSGTITTDGFIGTLVPSDITAWTLVASGPVAFSINSSLLGAADLCAFAGCGFEATATTLVYDFSNPVTDSSFRLLPSYIVNFQNGGVSEEILTSGAFYLIAADLPMTIATIASVPEPATITLLGLALAGLGFARKRSRQSTAV